MLYSSLKKFLHVAKRRKLDMKRDLNEDNVGECGRGGFAVFIRNFIHYMAILFQMK